MNNTFAHAGATPDANDVHAVSTVALLLVLLIVLLPVAALVALLWPERQPHHAHELLQTTDKEECLRTNGALQLD